jgi:hypothetical protein
MECVGDDSAAPSLRHLGPSGSFISFENLLEIKIGQVHVPVRYNVHGENILALSEANLEQLRGQIPVVPLTPGQRIRRIIGRRYLQRAGGVVPIYIDGYRSAAIRCVKKIDDISPRLCYVDCDVEPLSGLGPADVDQVPRGNDLIEGVVVNLIRLPVNLRV